MGTVRLVASDLDGTLLAPDGSLTERTARTWKALWDRGIETVLVTARPPRWVDALASITGEHGVVICLNGAFVYDAAHREVRSSRAMTPEVAGELIDSLRTIPGISFSAETADGFHREESYPGGSPLGVPENARARVGSLEKIDVPVGKLLAQTTELADEVFLDRVRTAIGDRALLSVSCGGLAEIGPAGVTKAGALAQWARDVRVDAAHTWAFGDMPNDIPMLRWAGVGWAVANADPAVHAVADRVCESNGDDGVAGALAELLA